MGTQIQMSKSFQSYYFASKKETRNNFLLQYFEVLTPQKYFKFNSDTLLNKYYKSNAILSKIIPYNYLRVRSNIKIYADVSIEKDLELEIFDSAESSYKIIATINLKLQRASTLIISATIQTEEHWTHMKYTNYMC